jgi:integrase
MILGHSSVTTTEIYLDHLTPEQKKAAMHGATHKAAHV